MANKLTPAQRRVLEYLMSASEGCVYKSQTDEKDELLALGCIEVGRNFGCYKITSAGRAALAEALAME